ncbi:hypothetical protein [Nostoc sp.]
MIPSSDVGAQGFAPLHQMRRHTIIICPNNFREMRSLLVPTSNFPR